MTKRVFTSIDLPPSIKQYFASLQNHGVYWIKWMPPKNFHITINFLGELNPAEIDIAKQVMAEAANGGIRPFSMRLDRLRAERDMLWVVSGQNETMDRLHWLLRTELKKAGVGKTERRGYLPHVFLGKSKTGRVMSWQPKKFEPQEFLVDRINLYESVLTPGAATHCLIESFRLGEERAAD